MNKKDELIPIINLISDISSINYLKKDKNLIGKIKTFQIIKNT